MDLQKELSETRRELSETRQELAQAQQSEQDWERKFGEFAQSVMQSSQAAEDAARSMYETLWQQEREALILQFQRRGKTLEQNLERARAERENATKAALECNDAFRAYRAQEPERAKDARRQLAAEFSAERERLAELNKRECARLAGESRELRGRLEQQGAERFNLEKRASELAIALERQKRETEKARLLADDVRKCQERVRTLEEFIRAQGERDYVRENEMLVGGLRQSEEKAAKLRTLYERSLATIRDMSDTNEENQKLRDIATRVTLENSKNAVEVQYLRGQLKQAERTMEMMTKDIEKMTAVVLNNAEDQFLSEQNERLRERVTEERKSSKECEAKLFTATQRFERELAKERAKTAATVTESTRTRLPLIQN